jgi:signal transduction histidine kinase
MAMISERPFSGSVAGEGTPASAAPERDATALLRHPATFVAQLPLATRLRLVITVSSAALGLGQGVPLVAAVSAGVAVTELGGQRWWRLGTYAQAFAVAVAVLATAPQSSAALPLLLLAAFRAGDLGRPRDVVAVTTATAVTLVAGWEALSGEVAPAAAVATDVGVWLGLATTLGMLQCLALRQSLHDDSGSEQAAQEATYLVHRLEQLVRRLPNGLHAPAVAEELLDSVLAHVVADRAAVLVRRDGDIASPLVIRGADRVPWRDPVRSPGTPSVSWKTSTTVADVRLEDRDGRRLGSAMLCLPLLDADAVLIGLVILERLTPTPFDPHEMGRAEQAAARLSPHLQAALMFGDLQVVASVAERERLAREMHDGIAQDLVASAFALDVLGRQLRSTSPDAEKAVAEVRGQLTRMVRDIRFSISDLRSSVRPERGVGAALSSQVQSLASSTGLTMHLSLRESTFRLPAQIEAALLRAAQSMLHDVRTDPTVTEIWLSLDVEPPQAELLVRHDGAAPGHLNDELVLYLAQLGVSAVAGPGELRLRTRPFERTAPALAGDGRP